MQLKRKYVYIFLYALLTGTAAIFLSPDLFFWLLMSSPTAEKILLFYAMYPIGGLCIGLAFLLLIVYTAHAVKGENGRLSFSNACKHAFHLLLLLFCMLLSLLALIILAGLFSFVYFHFVFGVEAGLASLFPLFLSFDSISYFIKLFLLPFALHPIFSTLIHPRPIRETFRHALQTWKPMYKPLLFWCAAITVIQTAISLITHGMPYGFHAIILTISSTILQTAFFHKMLAHYARGNSAA